MYSYAYSRYAADPPLVERGTRRAADVSLPVLPV